MEGIRLKIKALVIISLFLLSAISFAFAVGKLAIINNGEITDFYYSNDITPGENLTWNVVTFDKDEDINWTIKEGITVEQGDVLRIQFIKDPDDLILINYTELFTTDQIWAEFYLNDDLLGNDSSVLDFPFDKIDTDPDFAWTFLLPIILQVDASNVSTFQHYYDIYLPYEYSSSTESFDVTLTNDLFKIHYEYHKTVITFLLGKCKTDVVFEASFNLEQGYLDLLELYRKSKCEFGYQYLYHLILQNELSTEKISINWFTGLIAFLIIGVATIYKRRR